MTDVPSMLGRLAPWPAMDYAAFGEVEIKPLNRYQKLTGAFLGRNWVVIPHVTHSDEVDITDTEARRVQWNRDNPAHKVTMVVLLIKAMVAALKKFPQFNASLTEDGNSIVLKRYYNIGVAVDTPNGLLVPVIRESDKKSLGEIAETLTALAEKAKGKGLPMADMSGSSITISSLGHIGGTVFTPIINAPDVAILGVTRAHDVPTRGADQGIVWRSFLPLSLSYDHRVINGADAARFTRFIGEALRDETLFG